MVSGGIMNNVPGRCTDATVLVIDDEALIRQSITTYLGDSGFTVWEADDGPNGLKAAADHDPEVILLDLRMPEMDGLDVLAEVNRRHPETPVVVVTGAGVLKDAVEALRLGAFDFISKPIIDMAILEHAVSRAVEQRRLRRAHQQYQSRLEADVRSRTQDLQHRTDQLERANHQLGEEMAQHRRTEKALRQSQRRLSDVIAVFEGFIYAVDRNFQLTFMNPRLLEHTALQSAEGSGSSPDRTLSASSSSSSAQANSRASRYGAMSFQISGGQGSTNTSLP